MELVDLTTQEMADPIHEVNIKQGQVKLSQVKWQMHKSYSIYDAI